MKFMTISVSELPQPPAGSVRVFRFIWGSDGGRVATIEYGSTGADVRVMTREHARVMFNELLKIGASVRWGGVQEVPKGIGLTEEMRRAIQLLIG